VLLWIALPVDHPGQRARILGIDPEPVEVIEEPLGGNRVAFWRRTDVRTGERLRFTVDFEVELSEVHTDVDPERIEDYDRESAEFLRYTVAEPWLEISPEIAATAEEVVAGETNPWRAARRVFDWVVANIDYEYPAMEDRGAARSFTKRKGDCGEYSAVFIAMCRSLGIPARSVVCNWLHGSGHAWAEILVPPYGWVPVDTSVANLLATRGAATGGEEEVALFRRVSGLENEDPSWLFGNLYANRLIVCVGSNLELTSEKTGITRRFLFLQPGGQGGHPCSFEGKGVGEGAAPCWFYLYGEEATDERLAEERAEMELATAFYEANAYDRAEPALRRLVANSPKAAVPWLYLSRIYMDRGDYERAEEACRGCIAGDAGSVKPVIEAWARIGLGNCLDVAGRREEALAEYRTVVDSGIDYQGSAAAARKHLEEPFTPD
jgi:transglutaminase-like putative cysteine protease